MAKQSMFTLTIQNCIKSLLYVWLGWKGNKLDAMLSNEQAIVLCSSIYHDPIVKKSLHRKEAVEYILACARELQGSLRITPNNGIAGFNFPLGKTGK